MGEKRFLYAYSSGNSVAPFEIGEEGFTWAKPKFDKENQAVLQRTLDHACVGEYAMLFYKNNNRALLIRIK